MLCSEYLKQALDVATKVSVNIIVRERRKEEKESGFIFYPPTQLRQEYVCYPRERWNVTSRGRRGGGVPTHESESNVQALIGVDTLAPLAHF